MTDTQITQADRDAYAAALEKMKYARSADAVRNGFEDKHPIVQAFAAHRATRTDATPVAWMPIESAPKDAMILSRADGMIRLVMWEDGEWAQVGATIEVGWFEPDEWMPIPDATHPPATDVAALVDAAKDLRDVIAHMAAPARVDPDKYFSEQVRAFGDAFGYGALMTTASAIWRQNLDDLQGGEFAVGPCVTIAANQLKRLDAALAPFTKGQP